MVPAHVAGVLGHLALAPVWNQPPPIPSRSAWVSWTSLRADWASGVNEYSGVDARHGPAAGGLTAGRPPQRGIVGVLLGRG